MQMMLTVILAITVSNLLLLTLAVLHRSYGADPPFSGEEEDLLAYLSRIVVVSAMIAEAPAAERPALADLALAAVPKGTTLAGPSRDPVADPVAGLGPAEDHGLPETSFEVRLIPRALAARLPAEARFRLAPPTLAGSRYPDVVVAVPGAPALRYAHGGVDIPPPPGGWILLLFGTVAVVLTTALLAVWSRRAVVAPLERLAARVAGAGAPAGGEPFPAEGALEIRHLAEELSRADARQKAMLRARTEMLASVGHDLRTPLTRLRLRSETVDDPRLRREMVGEIDRLARLTDQALAFLRGDAVGEAFERVDVASLLSSLCDDFAELGCEVDCRLPPRLVATCRPQALSRAVGNLVENAFKYGDRVDLVLAADEAGGRYVVTVGDDGPGIDEGLADALVHPFVRADDGDGRGDPRGGFGLGLAIAARVAADHGGTLTLANRAPHGLLCRLDLPLDPRAGA